MTWVNGILAKVLGLMHFPFLTGVSVWGGAHYPVALSKVPTPSPRCSSGYSQVIAFF